MPKSLAGQMALLLGLALLVAQIVNFALILNERQKLTLAQTQGPAINRFVTVATDLRQAPAEFRDAVIEDNSRRGARFAIAGASAVPVQAQRHPQIEARLTQALATAGIRAGEARATEVTERRRPRSGTGKAEEHRILILSARLDSNAWLNGRLVIPRPDPFLTLRLAAATLLLYLIVLGASSLIAIRIARPLRDLARAAERFGGRGTPALVEPRGSADLRRALEAFNAMNRRVVALLDEKDRMLGAIGHDLRTPLASLRIRVESIEPESERQRMGEIIDEMATMLEDILVLARSGRSREEERVMDVTALVDALVEEYREMGHDVTLATSAREVLKVQPNLLRRAIRNLIDNGLKYGESVSISVRRDGESVGIEVLDNGAGIPPEQLEHVLEPFYRVEESRNRATGGTGLGLSIARAVAENHGGTLSLDNAPGAGLRATLKLGPTG
ncbi:sensor histidine kinase [Sphingosinicella rhizophila]|uniref:histidine kinase n=1 Tax=Sphingosinicella rhizophila TaxID=3050082 RepID=A0ABU3Q7R6_9SPHN|nr:HAMP domain-containing sensor histidine kinase [Sphingosinicella sp. GR2756]MDT9599367.1 HAMP domain-containing sensor histidine kinase [Sphingosinicella sp. GR2756]